MGSPQPLFFKTERVYYNVENNASKVETWQGKQSNNPVGVKGGWIIVSDGRGGLQTKHGTCGEESDEGVCERERDS